MTRRRSWSTIGRALGALVLLLVLGGVAALRTDTLTRFLLTRIVRGLTTPEASIESGEIRGSRLGSLRIEHLRLRLADSVDVLTVDSLALEYRLLPLLRRSVQIGSIGVYAPRTDLRDCVLERLRPDRETAEPTASAWNVAVDHVAVRGGRFVGGPCNGGRPWTADEVHLEAVRVELGARTAVQVDGLTGRITPSDAPDGYVATATFRGSLLDDVLTVDSLGLRSPASRLFAEGVLSRLGTPDEAPRVDFDVRAETLALRDLEPFTRRLASDGTVRVHARLRGVASALEVEGELGVLGGGAIEIDATVPAWRGAPPSYRATLSARAFDPSAVLVGAPPGAIDGTADVDLDGPEADVMSGTVRLDLTRADVQGSVAHLDLSADLTAGLAELTARVDAAQGQARLRGRARPFAATPVANLNGTVRWGRGPGPNEALVTADIALAATGQDSARWSGRVEAGNGSIGALAVDTLFADVTLDGDRLEGDVTVGVLAGTVRARLEGGFAGETDLSITRGSFAGIDVSALAGHGEGLTDLTGSMRGSWTGGVARAVLSLERARIRALDLDSGTVRVLAHADTLDVDADLAFAEGGLRSSARRIAGGRGDVTSAPAWLVREATFEALDVAALVDGAPTTRLSGRLEATVRGEAAETAEGRAELRLGSSTVRGRALDSARVHLTLDRGRADVRARAAAAGLTGDVIARVEHAGGTSRFEGDGRFAVSDLGVALRRDDVRGSLGGSVTFGGEASSGDDLRARGDLRILGGSVQDVPIDSVYAVVRYELPGLFVDTLRLQAEGLAAEGRARADRVDGALRPSSFDVTATLTGAGPLRAWPAAGVEDLAEARLVATGSPAGEDVAVRVELSGSGLVRGDMHVPSFAADARGRLGPELSFALLEAHATGEAVEIGGWAVERAEIAAVPDEDGLATTVAVDFDPIRRASAAGRVRTVDGVTEITLRALDVALGDQTWALDGESRLRLDGDVEVEGFVLSSASGRIAARGVVRRSGAQDLQLDLEGVRLSGLSELLGWSGVDGVVDGSVDLAGTAGAPVAVANVSARGSLPGAGPASLTLDLRYDSTTLRAQGSLDAAAAHIGDFRVELPVDVRLLPTDSSPAGARLVEGGAVSGDLEARDLSLSWLSPFLPEERIVNLEGRLRADVTAEGTTDRVVLAGTIDADSVSAFQPELGLRLHAGSLRARLEDDRLLVDRAQIRSGGGRLTATGSLGTGASAARDLALEVTLAGFQAIRTDVFRAVVDGRLGVTGTLDAPVVTGGIDVLGGDVHLGGRFAGTRAEAVELTAEDYEMLAERFGYRAPAEQTVAGADAAGPLALAVDVRLGRDVWVRQRASPTVSVQLTGELRVEKAPHELERVYGTLEAVPRGSHVEQFGRRFDITRGSVSFNGPPEELVVDIESAYRVPSRGDPTAPEVSIGLGVTGSLDSLRVVLSSEPEMENADIVSYLATGRPASQTLDLESTNTGLVERGATLALGRATDAFEEFASQSVGLDVMEIRTEGVTGATVVAGRYVSPRLYLGFKQPVSFRKTEAGSANRARAPEIEIEVQAFRWLLLNLQRGGNRLELFLRSRYAY